MTSFADALDELAAAPLDAFVAERKRLAGEVRAGGDRAGAAQVLKVPKPSAAEWALAAVAREDPETVAAWLEVATELREASARPGEVGGDAVRAAMAAHRTATARLVGIVRDRGGLTDAMTDRVRAALQAATADADAAAALQAGRPPGFGTEGAAPAPRRPRSRDTAAGDASDPRDSAAAAAAEEAARREAEAAAERERRAAFERKLEEAKAEVERLRDEASRTAAAAAAADEALEDARRSLHRRESEAAAAHDAAAAAAEAAAEARRAVEALRRGR